MIGIGLGVTQLRKVAASVAPEYVEPVDDDPVTPPVEDPAPPTETPTDPVTEEPEPGFDPNFTLPNRIEIADSGQSAIRTTNDPGTFGVAYVATPISGDEYWEYEIQNSTPRGATFAIGITTLDMPLNGTPGERATEIAWWSDGTIRQNGATLVDLGSGGALSRGDLAGVAINASGQVFLFKNCAALNAGATVGSLASGTRYPFLALYSAKSRINMNFSTARFECSLPDGFYPIGQVPLPPSGIAALTTVGSGTWTVPAGVTTLSEVLIVAGGGGGGSGSYGAGGGGGGVIRLTDVTVTPGSSISYTVGAGGAGGVAMNTPTTAFQGDDGGNSVFGANTAIGGGGGGGGRSSDGGTASSGRSGGSGGGRSKTAGTAGAGTSGQGNAGGNGLDNTGGGGGGGVAAAGSAAVSGQAGAGGAGQLFSGFTAYGASGYFGGGGGGGAGGQSVRAGAGGIGGGGNGGLFPNDNTADSYGDGRNGVANTGGGGGGPKNNGATSVTFNGGAGGSGVILISY